MRDGHRRVKALRPALSELCHLLDVRTETFVVDSPFWGERSRYIGGPTTWTSATLCGRAATGTIKGTKAATSNRVARQRREVGRGVVLS